jgi:gas vesicle protein
MSENNNDLLVGFIVGGLIGITLGILFAPKSGKETREDIARKAKEGYGKVSEKYQEASGVESFRDYKGGPDEELA